MNAGRAASSVEGKAAADSFVKAFPHRLQPRRGSIPRSGLLLAAQEPCHSSRRGFGRERPGVVPGPKLSGQRRGPRASARASPGSPRKLFPRDRRCSVGHRVDNDDSTRAASNRVAWNAPGGVVKALPARETAACRGRTCDGALEHDTDVASLGVEPHSMGRRKDGVR